MGHLTFKDVERLFLELYEKEEGLKPVTTIVIVRKEWWEDWQSIFWKSRGMHTEEEVNAYKKFYAGEQ